MGLGYISKFQVFIDCLFYQKLDWHKEVFWQTCLQEETQTMVKCSLNHSRKKYGVLNYNGNAEKKILTSLEFRRTCIKWVNAILEIIFKFMFVNVCYDGSTSVILIYWVISDLRNDEFFLSSQ